MYKSGQVLHTDADFDNAVLFAIPVEVWQRGRKIDKGGVIRYHSPAAVYIEDCYYFKITYEFRVI